MRRSFLLGVVLAGVLAGCSLGNGSHDSLMFTAQRTTVLNGDQPQHWKTYRTRTIRCDGNHPASGGDNALLRDPCAAIAYMAGLHHNLACFPSGSLIGPTRTVFRNIIQGTVNGKHVNLTVAGSCDLSQESIHSRLYDARLAVSRTVR